MNTEPDVLRPRVKASELGLVTAPGIAAPVMARRDATPKRAGAAAPEWSERSIPVSAIRRAFAAADPEAREKILTWAFAVDVEDPDEKRPLDILSAAIAEEREVRDLRSGLLEEHVPAIWRRFIERPEVADALVTLAARLPAKDVTDLDKRWRLPTSPLMRAHELTALYGWTTPPEAADLAPFLALADAVEELHVATGIKVGRASSGESLQRSVDLVAERSPGLVDAVRAEIERVRRVLEIERRKETAEAQAAEGVVRRPPSSVGIDPILLEPEALPPEQLVELPAAVGTNTTLRRAAVPVEELAPASAPAPEVDVAALPREVPEPTRDVAPTVEPSAVAPRVEVSANPSSTGGGARVAVVVLFLVALVAALVVMLSRGDGGLDASPSAAPVTPSATFVSHAPAPASASPASSPSVPATNPSAPDPSTPVTSSTGAVRPPLLPTSGTAAASGTVGTATSATAGTGAGSPSASPPIHSQSTASSSSTGPDIF